MNTLLLFIVLFSSLISFAQSKEIGFYIPFKFKNLDPAKLYYVEEWEISRAIHDTLIRSYGMDALIRPSLAEKWSYQKNELRFQLKDKLKFSNGQKIEARHVVESWKRYLILDKSNASILKQCLLQEKKLKTIKEKHPSLKIVDGKVFALKIKSGCKDRLIHELGQPIYGIVNTDSLDSKLTLPLDSPASCPLAILLIKTASLLS